MKRRRFLVICSASAGLAVAAPIAFDRWADQRRNQAQAAYRQQHQLEDAPPGQLAPVTLATLMATTEALLADKLTERTHYENFFSWRSSHIAGYKKLYESFQKTLDAAAQKTASKVFADCDITQRQKILEQVAGVSFKPGIYLGEGQLNQAKEAVLGEEPTVFDQYIIPDIFRLFARTDALLALGYETWEGKARGLANYTRPMTDLQPAS